MPISSPESSIIRFALANTFRVKLVHVVEARLGRTSVRLAVLGAVVVMRSFCSCTCVVLVGFALLLSSSVYVVRPQLCSPAALDVPHACRAHSCTTQSRRVSLKPMWTERGEQGQDCSRRPLNLATTSSCTLL